MLIYATPVRAHAAIRYLLFACRAAHAVLRSLHADADAADFCHYADALRAADTLLALIYATRCRHYVMLRYIAILRATRDFTIFDARLHDMLRHMLAVYAIFYAFA